MIAAARADELKQAGVAAFETAVDDADRLAPQDRRAAVAGLTGNWKRIRQTAVDAVPVFPRPDLRAGSSR